MFEELGITIPRSDDYLSKVIVETGCMIVRGTYYFKRIFDDGCAELIRFDDSIKKWVILCFIKLPE